MISPSGAVRSASGLTRAGAVRTMAERYGWDPNRVDRAILRLADHMGGTNEVYYPDPANHREVTVVWITRRGRDSYEISEENRPARLAAVPGVRYTSVVSRGKAASVRKSTQEATDMATATRGRGKTAAAKKAAPAPEPEELEDELEEELEEEEELEDELEDEEEDEPEEDDEDEDDEPEEVEDETEEDEEDEDDEVKDYTPYAGKSPTPTMDDFATWLLAEVYGDELPEDHDEASFREGVRLGGTLRMEFQRSDFCRERREERKRESAAAKAVKPAKTAKAAEPESAKTKGKATKAPVKAAAPTTKAAASTKRTVPGKPAGRTADRPAAAKPAAKAGSRRAGRKAAEEPF